MTREITTKTEKTFFSRPWPWAYIVNGANAAASIARISAWARAINNNNNNKQICITPQGRNFRGAEKQGPSDVDASEYSMSYFFVFFSMCTCVLLTINYYFAQTLSFWSAVIQPFL